MLSTTNYNTAEYDAYAISSLLSFGAELNSTDVTAPSVSDDKLSTEEVLRQQVAAMSKRLQDQENYIGFLCHELRIPLQGFVAGASLMKAKLNGTKSPTMVDEIDTRELIDMLEQSAAQQKLLLDNNLELLKLRKRKIELEEILFSPGKLFEKVKKTFEATLIEKGIQLITCVPDKNIYIKGDPHRINQIVSNLISNAMKFTSAGSITLSAEIQIVEQDKIEMIIKVADTGIGMIEAEKAKLFENYSQANGAISRLYGGSGLGLAICKELVELMNGNISVESTKGQGSTFTCKIFCKNLTLQDKLQVSAFASRKSPEFSSCYSLPSLHILLVEDNKVNSKLLSQMLVNNGHTCEIAENGVEAISKWQQSLRIHSSQDGSVIESAFDLIIMDELMPVMRGHEAAEKIRQEEKAKSIQSPISILSATGTDKKEELDELKKYGINAVIQKPFTYEQLRDAIFKLLPQYVLPCSLADNSNNVSSIKNPHGSIKNLASNSNAFFSGSHRSSSCSEAITVTTNRSPVSVV